MPLWRVDIGDVSHRFVEAESRSEAVEAVKHAIVSALDLRARPAQSTLARLYEEAGPNKRKRLLAAMDGLTDPRTDQRRTARRRLARLIRYDQQDRAWVKSQLAGSPDMPVDPESLQELTKIIELRHAEENLRRFRSDSTPFHS